MLNLNPKIKAGAVVSVALAVALAVAEAFGISPDPRVAEFIAPFVPVVVGYFKRDTSVAAAAPANAGNAAPPVAK